MRQQAGRLLVVEDDHSLVKLLEEQFGQLGYRVSSVTTGGEALFLAQDQRFDLIILDLNLPDIDGLEVAQLLRESCDASILILTARGDVDSRVEGLYAGAGDYLTKPFSMHELAARVHARLRERERLATELRYGDARLDPNSNSLSLNGSIVVLPELEYRLFETLVANRGRLYSKEELVRHLYDDQQPGSNTIEVFVHNLRKRLASLGIKDAIKTVRGKGYLVK